MIHAIVSRSLHIHLLECKQDTRHQLVIILKVPIFNRPRSLGMSLVVLDMLRLVASQDPIMYQVLPIHLRLFMHLFHQATLQPDILPYQEDQETQMNQITHGIPPGIMLTQTINTDNKTNILVGHDLGSH